jgi:hypothetical protein
VRWALVVAVCLLAVGTGAHHDGVRTPESVGLLADFDGDGQADPGTIFQWPGSPAFEIFIRCSGGGTMYLHTTVSSLGEYDVVWSASDVDGDGRDDLVAYARAQRSHYIWFAGRALYRECHHLACTDYAPIDVNGDGIADYNVWVTAWLTCR